MVSIGSLPLSTRTQGALTRGGIETLYDLVNYKNQELKKLYGLGKNGLKEIEEMLRSFGLSERR
jgi:DNA-directed RNA polymerase alpha subunit